jgi:hypothetical protein
MDRDRDRDMDRDRDRDSNMERNGDGDRPRTRTGTGIQKGTGTFPRGVRPRRTTFEFENRCEFETEFENNLRYDSGVHTGLINGKNRGQKSRDSVRLKSSQ